MSMEIQNTKWNPNPKISKRNPRNWKWKSKAAPAPPLSAIPIRLPSQKNIENDMQQQSAGGELS